jgi:hypothetical protein
VSAIVPAEILSPVKISDSGFLKAPVQSSFCRRCCLPILIVGTLGQKLLDTEDLLGGRLFGWGKVFGIHGTNIYWIIDT